MVAAETRGGRKPWEADDHEADDHHVIVQAHGIPLAAPLTGGDRNDVTHLIPLIQAVPPRLRQARSAAAR
jgi:hypothetical protein